MIPLIIWAIKEVAEDIAEDQAEKLATGVADSVLKSLDLCTLTEAELAATTSAQQVQDAVLAKVKATLSNAGQA
jgi:hypothetical protein